jgi:hypothetical protein
MTSEEGKAFRSRGYEHFLQQTFAGESALLQQIRSALMTPYTQIDIPENLTFDYTPQYSQLYITLFEAGQRPLRWGAKLFTLEQSFNHSVKRLTQQPRFKDFTVYDPSRCRIMFEIVTEEYPCDIRSMTARRFGKNRFEPGITGLYCKYENKTRYFMPTDAVTHSVMSVNQLLNFLSKRFGIAKRTRKISERVQLMRSLPIEYRFIKSVAFVTYEEKLLPLHRGYPMPVELSKARVEETMMHSIHWLADNMKEDGKFLYYYDPVTDSKIDFQHPRQIDPPYYNILRHSGGTITLLLGYEHEGDARLLQCAQKSIEYFLTTLRENIVDGAYTCYPFYNQKSKLGGAGIGLVSLMHWYRLTKDDRHRKYTDGLVRHILSRVHESGEMIGYYIHPQYDEGTPLNNPDEKQLCELFSFYYPGEALLGLAMYDALYDDLENDFRQSLRRLSKKALDFLVKKRPDKYPKLFAPLPSDAWLMQAIEAWDDVPEVVEEAHRQFVYLDAKKMREQMYTPQNAPEFDYIGGFFYQYGDHVYHDGSRCEGMICAYRLAKKHDLKRFASETFNAMLMSAKGLLYTYNSPDSVYAHLYPEKSIGSFRFKLTRQWVRVDSVQHTACFYAGLIRLL